MMAAGALVVATGTTFAHPPADEISPPSPMPNRRISAGTRRRPRSHSKETLPNAPVARPAKGASLAECLAAMDRALDQGSIGFIAFTVMWRRISLDWSDRKIAAEQGRLVHCLRRSIARRGLANALVIPVLERTHRHGLHGHILAQCPVKDHAAVLDAVETSLQRRYGDLPPRTFNRDGWRRGSITTARAARGALRYRLKSLPFLPIDHDVRRGVGLLPINAITVRCSTGREPTHAG